MTKFLEETDVINYSNKEIQKLAISLSDDCKTDVEIAKNCFLYVRDKINHSGDYIEKLAFELQEHEFDLPEIYEEPLEVVIQALQKFKTYDEMCENFPDVK